MRQSKNACLVGLSGIVILETESTFKVVTKKDRLKGILATFLSIFPSLLAIPCSDPQGERYICFWRAALLHTRDLDVSFGHTDIR